MNINFDPNYRRNWMFPRNIRKIYPWKLAQICQILSQLSLNDWSQDIQNKFSNLLTSGNLKSQNVIRDPKSGGARTYISQLESLGLLYKRKNVVDFTLAGKSLIEFETPLKVLQTQLLNYQYPSTYSSGRNVRIHPEINVKPFLLVLKILKNPGIQHISVDELVFCVLYGHNKGSEKRIIDKIKSFRTQNGNRKTLVNFLDNPIEDLYTPKASDKNNISKLLEEALNVANTFKNYLISSSLAYEHEGTKEIYSSEDFAEVIEKAISDIDSFIPYTSGQEENFTRSYGAWNRKKDTSVNVQRQKLSQGEAIISAQFFEFIGNRLIIDNADIFIDRMKLDFGFTREQVLNIIEPLIPKALGFFESKYLELSKGGVATFAAFEKATTELFENRLGIKASHTGSRYKQGVGGYSDIMLEDDTSNECAIVDTKASSYYTLPSQDYAKMLSNYVPNFHHLIDDDTKGLGFILYIAGGLGGEIQSKLLTLYKESGYPASAINAKTLIEVAQIKDIESKQIWDRFKKNKVLKTSDFH